MVRHRDVAVVKPDTAIVQVNPGLRFYGRFATERSLARLVSDYRLSNAHLYKTGRPVGRLGGFAVDLPAPSGGREEVLRSGSTGMDAGRAVLGQGWPVTACPRSGAGARELERSESRTRGQGPFGYFWGCLPTVPRRKGETHRKS